MTKAATKTDNSYLSDKIMLRLNNLPFKKNLTVLDCYFGAGEIWNSVKSKTDISILILGIDIKSGKNLVGDNKKFLKTMDLSKYDIIDLDAYGVPFEQLDIILNREYTGTLFVTFIQSMYGALNEKLLHAYGYTPAMLSKITSIFVRDGIKKIEHYLYTKGVRKIIYKSKDKKYYITFSV
jgi:tRNA G26 N,N-dimethylase Trm1